MATIKAIEGRSVHQIQSGQVIVDLNSVVKELVENSLDAGATSIEVRFKNQGLGSIEVQDNGKGISPDDYDTVALKHHTSKLSSYEDLTSLDTFGFRGEALSSLCALSKFHVVTARAEDGAIGKRLDFEVSGKLKDTTVTSAQKGTTVTVEDLFCNLPVRRKEIEKNIKREYGKVIGLLHAYACISVGVRFSVTNHMPKGKKAVVFSTKSNTTTKENIVNVFGAKTLLALIKLDLHLQMDPSKGPSTQGAKSWSTQAIDHSMEVVVQGHISKPVFGEGRQAPDRQMFFVNSRPCGLPQVAKAVNEVYKSFNVSQMPFVFANLIMDTNSYDVNVSPDKRTIMLHDQTALLERLKTALTELFEQTDHTVPQSTFPNRKLPAYQPLTIPQRTSDWPILTTDATEGGGPEANGSDSEGSSSSAEMTRPYQRNVSASPPSLIQHWTGRDTELRSEKPGSKKQSVKPSVAESKLQRLMQKFDETETGDDHVQTAFALTVQAPQESVPEVTSSAAKVEDERSALTHSVKTDESTEASAPNPLSTPYDDLFSQQPPQASASIKETGLHPSPPPETMESSAPRLRQMGGPDPSATRSQEMRTQGAIPATTPGALKTSPGPVANAFDRMRPKRTPLQTAEITVGDVTTTTVLGSSPAYKRRRIHQPENSQTIAQFCGSPLVARGLRNFAAPGSEMHVDNGDLPRSQHQYSGESDEEGEPDTNSDAAETEAEEVLPTGDDPITSDPVDALLPALADDDAYDGDYVDEQERKIREDEKVALMIQEAENAAARPTEDNLRRASQILKNGIRRKEATLQLMSVIETSITDIRRLSERVNSNDTTANSCQANSVIKDELNDSNAESKLSLTVSKADFGRMSIVGQFNLGFILAVRPASKPGDEDELFIIDQHAADEKYNYERLQRTVTLQSQRLVRPKPLEITAVDEEVILNNGPALKANGFEVEISSATLDDEDHDESMATERRQCRLLTLPISGEKTFNLSDLEELLHLLSETPSGTSEIPRPRKVQKMLAMRACRSSIMVGKTLTVPLMQRVVKHMGEMEKPWNCPHGRPTMRHLAGLGAWRQWREGDRVDEDDRAGAGVGSVGWKAWLEKRKRVSQM